MDSLFRQLCSLKLLHRAWKMVKLKNSVGGIDGISMAELGKYLYDLQKELKKRTWKPEPYLQIEIKKKKNDTERRKLGLLSIKDKIVQQAIKLLIEPRFENLFFGKYGERINLSVYECLFTTGRFKQIQETILKRINREEDTVVYYPICVNCYTRIVYQPEKDQKLETVFMA